MRIVEQEEKEYFGKSGDDYYYLVKNEEGVFKILDAEGRNVYGDDGVDNVKEFVISAIRELELDEVAYEVVEKYLLEPEKTEEPKPEEPEEPKEEKPEEEPEEKPKEEEPKPEEPEPEEESEEETREEPREPIESIVGESDGGISGESIEEVSMSTEDIINMAIKAGWNWREFVERVPDLNTEEVKEIFRRKGGKVDESKEIIADENIAGKEYYDAPVYIRLGERVWVIESKGEKLFFKDKDRAERFVVEGK